MIAQLLVRQAPHQQKSASHFSCKGSRANGTARLTVWVWECLPPVEVDPDLAVLDCRHRQVSKKLSLKSHWLPCMKLVIFVSRSTVSTPHCRTSSVIAESIDFPRCIISVHEIDKKPGNSTLMQVYGALEWGQSQLDLQGSIARRRAKISINNASETSSYRA